MSREDGRYAGKIIRGYLEEQEFQGDTVLVMCFDVDLGDGTVTCRHPTEGGDKNMLGRIAQDVCRDLELGDWPRCIANVGDAAGRDCTVIAKTKDGKRGSFQKFYIATSGGGRPAEQSTIDRKLREMSGETVPF